MFAMVKIPLAVLLAAAAGVAVSRAMGWALHAGELTAAAGVALVAGEAALIPMLLARHSTQAAVAQAALIATMIHLFAFVVAMAVILFGKIGLSPAFSYWLIAMYFATLIALVSALVRQMKTAPAAPVTGKQ